MLGLFAFDHKGGESYEEVTAPLRSLPGKGAQFAWNEQKERSYQLLLSIMNNRTYLAPYNHRTHLVTDACPWGYQPLLI